MPVTIKMFGEKAQPLYGLFKKFTWTEECMTSFELHKECLVKAPIFQSATCYKEFNVHIDVPAFTVGVVLTQHGEEILDFLIIFASFQRNTMELIS